jgi:hypothetical protein
MDKFEAVIKTQCILVDGLSRALKLIENPKKKEDGGNKDG